VAGGDLHLRAGRRGFAVLEERAPAGGLGAERGLEQPLEEPVAERLGRLQAEQQLGGLAPLRDRPLAVRQQEEARDDLLEQDVERLEVLVGDLPGRRRDVATLLPRQGRARERWAPYCIVSL
jgi:hypothetical protein